MQRILVIVGMVAMVACSGKSSTAPVTGNVAGNWSGPLADSFLGGGTVAFSLIQASDDSLTGTWATTFPNPANDLFGNVTGTVSGSTVSIILVPANPPTCQFGPYRFTATLSGTTFMSGKFAPAYGCVVADSGTFSATRQ